MPDGLPDVPEELLEGIGATMDDGDATPAPVAATTPEAPVAATPEGQATDEAAPDATDSFTKLDPNAIPPEMRPYYESMQADYTRKTQEVAPWRKLGDELGLSSPEDVRQAAELWAYLQDQNNLGQFYDQLGQVLGKATPAPAAAVVPEPVAEDFSALDDPALAEIRRELATVKAQVAERDSAAQQEALQWALLGEMNRQEALLKDQHPEWGQSDGDNVSEEWAAVWNLAPAFNGDLVRAAQVIETAQQAGITRLLNGKASAAETPGLVAEAPSRVGTVVPEPADFSDLELREQTAQAKEFLRGIANQSE